MNFLIVEIYIVAFLIGQIVPVYVWFTELPSWPRGTPSKSTSTEAPPQEGAKCRARGGSPHTTSWKAPTLFTPSLLHHFPIRNTLALRAPKPTTGWVSGGGHRLKMGPTQELPFPPPHTTATGSPEARSCLEEQPKASLQSLYCSKLRCSPSY